MRLTVFADYSLRVLMYVAARQDVTTTIAEIAAAFNISESHLSKVVADLGRKGVLTNARGRGGGIALARPAASISIGTVIRAAETDALVECFAPRSNRCAITPACRLRSVLREALGAFYATLDRYTLEDVVHNRQRLRRLLEPRPTTAY